MSSGNLTKKHLADKSNSLFCFNLKFSHYPHNIRPCCENISKMACEISEKSGK